MDGRWRIQLFDGLQAQRGDRVVTRFRSQRTAALLAYLAFFHQRAHPRQVLIELLWPQWDAELGRHNLSVALSSLREQLETPEPSPAVIRADRFAVGLNAEAITTDVAEFEAALAGAATAGPADRVSLLEQAIERHGRSLLPGFYEDWILPEQQRLDEQLHQALRELSAHWAEAGDLDRAISLARRAVATDPLREEAQRELMRLLAAAGQSGVALRQYRELEQRLRQELNAAPDPATRALVESLQSGNHGAGTPSVAAPQPQEAPVVTAPAPGKSAARALDSSPERGSARETEPVGGAVPLGSRFYVVRPADGKLAAAIGRRDSIILINGPRQVGKTSLLARGLQQGRQDGMRVALTDLDRLNAAHLESADALLLALAHSLADRLDLPSSPAAMWEPQRGANPNFERYMRREVLGTVSTPLLWALDEVDRLFTCSFGGEIFGLFRSWHNERALEPDSPWSRLTLAIGYATEAHLFISDLNKSPFNVGTRLTLEDFTLPQVADLNRRYGSPLRGPGEIERFYRLVGGHPHLVRGGLYEMTTSDLDLAAIEAQAGRDDGIFGGHLQRMQDALSRDPELSEVVRGMLAGSPCLTARSFSRLRSAGLVTGDSEEEARPRCELYAHYLSRHLL
jgi:DNA-binding SARP family transcriptional activator